MYFTTRLFYKLKYSDEISTFESIPIQGKTTYFLNKKKKKKKKKQWVIKTMIYAYFCLFSASKSIMSYGKLITRFTTGGHDIFITCPAKSMHRQPGSPMGSRCMFFMGQMMKILYPPVVQRLITKYCQV